jgi:hypothetical protein
MAGQLDALLAAGRQAHQGIMVDACTITRATQPTLNRTTSVNTPGSVTTLYTGPCRVKAQRVPRNEQAGERLTVVARYEVALPFGAVAVDDLQVGDSVTVTASGDARLVGQHFAVMAVDFGSTATAWRLSVEGIT